MRPVSSCWAEARLQVLPADATREDIDTARRLFVLGALCLWQLQQLMRERPAAQQAQFEEELRAELAVFQATVGTELEGRV